MLRRDRVLFGIGIVLAAGLAAWGGHAILPRGGADRAILSGWIYLTLVALGFPLFRFEVRSLPLAVAVVAVGRGLSLLLAVGSRAFSGEAGRDLLLTVLFAAVVGTWAWAGRRWGAGRRLGTAVGSGLGLFLLSGWMLLAPLASRVPVRGTGWLLDASAPVALDRVWQGQLLFSADVYEHLRYPDRPLPHRSFGRGCLVWIGCIALGGGLGLFAGGRKRTS